MLSTHKRRSHLRILILAFVASLISIFSGAATSNPKQELSERLLKEGRNRNAVIEITRLTLKGSPVLFAKKFAGDDDWLSGLTVSVKNISPKPIIYLVINLNLFGKGDEEPTGKLPFIYPLRYGRYVGKEPTEHLFLTDVPDPIEPGSTRDIVLTEEEYTSLKTNLLVGGYSLTMKEVELLIADVYFADGTRWYKGMRLKRNPDNPVEWIKEAPDRVRLERKPNPTNSLRASQAKADFIFASFIPGMMPSLSTSRARLPGVARP